ncbi:MAG: hypothetical protein ABSH52_31630 [Terriglobia bacterium]|jgi:hypothetical protein
MAIGTILKPDTDQLLLDSQVEAPLFSFTAEEFNIIAFRLWRRVSDVGTVADDCGCCKGEAQQCHTACR